MKKSIFFMVFFLFFLTNLTFANENIENIKSDQFIIVNKSLNKLAFFEGGKLINEFSVATGASAGSTPEGEFKVTVKWECPVYYKTKSGGCAEGNPLGPRWIGLNVPGTAGYTYGIHGNASPWSIGTYASAGCVRMHNWQVTQLFEIVKYNTPVVIIRSGETFEEIAKNHGYNVIPTKKVNEEITLIGETKAYYGAHEGLSLDEPIISQKVTVTEKYDDWFYINTNEKNYWINTKNYVNGEVVTEDTYLFIDDGQVTYSFPKDEAKKTEMKNPLILHSVQHADGWYYVQSEKDENTWVKTDSIKKVTEKEWEFQKELSSYANRLLNDMKELNNEQSFMSFLTKELFS